MGHSLSKVCAPQVKRLVAVGGRSSAYEKDLNAKQATGSRDALAKSIYEKLFSWIVGGVNVSLASHRTSSGMAQPRLCVVARVTCEFVVSVHRHSGHLWV